MPAPTLRSRPKRSTWTLVARPPMLKSKSGTRIIGLLTASSVINTARMVGATLGVALLGGLFAMHAGNGPSSAEAIVAGVRPAMLGGAIAEGLGALLAFLAIPTAMLSAHAQARLISAWSE